jgi:flavin-dependent dehydrogenase
LAQTAGVELRTHTQVIAAGSGYLTISHEEKRERIGSTVIIGADGPRSAVASWFNLPSPTHFLTAHQAIVAGEPYAADEVEIFFGSRVAPGFFAWVVPAETGCLRIGLASPPKTATDALLPLFLAKHFPGRVLEHITGRIPLGFPMLTVGNGVLLVGDAAGQVKPTSGGGLYTGGVCAKIAGEVAGYVALTGKATAEALSLYEHRWRREIGEELRAGLMIHRAFASLSDQEIDAIFTVLDDPAILHTIAENGDIDYPSRLIPSFLSHRHLWPRLLSFIPALGGWQRIEKLAQAAFAPNNCPPL